MIFPVVDVVDALDDMTPEERVELDEEIEAGYRDFEKGEVVVTSWRGNSVGYRASGGLGPTALASGRLPMSRERSQPITIHEQDRLETVPRH